MSARASNGWRLKRTAPLFPICRQLVAIADYTTAEGRSTVCGLVHDADTAHPVLAAVVVELEDGSTRCYDPCGVHIPAPAARARELTVGEAKWHVG